MMMMMIVNWRTDDSGTLTTDRVTENYANFQLLDDSGKKWLIPIGGMRFNEWPMAILSNGLFICVRFMHEIC